MRKDREKALVALLTSDTQAEAAQKAGVSRRTISSYLADPEFNAEYRRRKRSILTEAARQLQRNMKSAISTLDSISKSKDSKDSDRIAASRLILEFSLRYEEITDIMTRMEELEDRILNNPESMGTSSR